LTIIFQKGEEFWIEAFTVARSSISAGGFGITNFTLQRAGTFLGAALAVDTAGAVADIADVIAFVRNDDVTELTFGQALSILEVVRTNGSSNAVTFGCHVIVFMRGTG